MLIAAIKIFQPRFLPGCRSKNAGPSLPVHAAIASTGER